jgi:5-methylcytosine-specific restriction endonuclease McrA
MLSPVPKPEPRKRVKARRQRARMTARKSCRAARFQRAGGCCEVCGRPVKLHVSEARSVWEIANVHEVKPRSLGGSAVDVTNTKVLCLDCHRKAHRL